MDKYIIRSIIKFNMMASYSAFSSVGNLDEVLIFFFFFACLSFHLLLASGSAVMKNPANLAKHQANPKVAPVIAKMMNKFGGTSK